MKTLTLTITAFLFIFGLAMMMNDNDNLWVNILGGVFVFLSGLIFKLCSNNDLSEYSNEFIPNDYDSTNK